MNFGRHTGFVTWTKGLVERMKTMPEPEYLCLSDDKLYAEEELFKCPKCGEYLCPDCGGEVSTIKEHDEATKANG